MFDFDTPYRCQIKKLFSVELKNDRITPARAQRSVSLFTVYRDGSTSASRFSVSVKREAAAAQRDREDHFFFTMMEGKKDILDEKLKFCGQTNRGTDEERSVWTCNQPLPGHPIEDTNTHYRQRWPIRAVAVVDSPSHSKHSLVLTGRCYLVNIRVRTHYIVSDLQYRPWGIFACVGITNKSESPLKHSIYLVFYSGSGGVATGATEHRAGNDRPMHPVLRGRAASAGTFARGGVQDRRSRAFPVRRQ